MNDTTTIQAKVVMTTFSEAIKTARSLNTAIQNMCPRCVELVQKALSEEEIQDQQYKESQKSNDHRKNWRVTSSPVTEQTQTTADTATNNHLVWS